MPELSEDEKKFINALGRRLPSRCHVAVTNIGIPLIVLMIAWLGSEAVSLRDTVRDTQRQIGWISDTVGQHESALRALSATVASLWTFETHRLPEQDRKP